MNRGPIYVAGIQRSGTTLLFALLASHPNIAMTRRTNLWKYFFDRYGDLRHHDNFERCLSTLMRYKRLLILKPDPERIRREFWQGEPTYGRLFALIYEHHAQGLGKLRWGDKSSNTERYADAIFASYPTARIIHMIRDPRDRFCSSRTRWGKSRGRVGVGTAVWLSSIQDAKRNQEKYPEAYKVVRYETLATEPEQTLRKICAFVGEEYTPAMLTMGGVTNFRDSGGNSSYGPHQPEGVSTRSIGRYRQMMSRRELAFMQAYAGSNMVGHDYRLEEFDLPLTDLLLFFFLDTPWNLARMVATRAKEASENKLGRTLPSRRLLP